MLRPFTLSDCDSDIANNWLLLVSMKQFTSVDFANAQWEQARVKEDLEPIRIFTIALPLPHPFTFSGKTLKLAKIFTVAKKYLLSIFWLILDEHLVYCCYL